MGVPISVRALAELELRRRKAEGSSDPEILASRTACEASLAEFVRQAWHIIEPATDLEWNWHLDVICEYTQAFYDGRLTRLILNVPPGCGKSIVFSVMGPAHRWATHPSERMMNFTNESGLASRDAERMKQIIVSDWYRARWGSRFELSKTQNEKLLFATDKMGFRQGLGLKGNITGKRGSRLGIDDPVDAKKAFSDIEIRSANATYDQAVSSRLNDPRADSIGLIMQRTRVDDLTGHLLDKKETKWVRVCIAHEYEGTPGYDPVRDLGPEYAHLADPRTQPGQLMFPERFTPSVIAAMKEDLGDYGYAAQAQQRPSPLTGGIIKQAYWRIWPDDKPMPKILHAFASYDTAFSERDLKDNAYSAATVWGVWWDETDIPKHHDPRSKDPAGRHKLLLLSAWWDRVDIDDLLKQAMEIEESKLRHDQDAHLVEDMASGKSLIQVLRRRSKVRVLRYDPKNDGGGDKVFRANIAARAFRAGLIYAPNRPWAHQVIGLVGQFGPGAGALSKDVTDTATQAVNYLSNGWWIHHPDDDRPPPDETSIDHDDDEPTEMDRLSARTTGKGYGAW